MRRLVTYLGVSLLVGCATPAVRPWSARSPEATATVAPSRAYAVAIAEGLLGQSTVRIKGRRYPDDCTGLVRGVFESMGVGLFADARRGDNGVTSIFRFAQEHGRVFRGGRPLPGDLVFFKDTYDQNHDGRFDDGLTHVGLVERVDEEDSRP